MVHVSVKIYGIRPRFLKEDPFEMVVRDCANSVIFTAPSGYTYYYELDSTCDVKITLVGDDLVSTNCSRTMKEIEGEVDQLIVEYPDGKKKHYDLFPDTFVMKERHESKTEVEDHTVDNNEKEDNNEQIYHEVNDAPESDDPINNEKE
jgi:hypothetical protein